MPAHRQQLYGGTSLRAVGYEYVLFNPHGVLLSVLQPAGLCLRERLRFRFVPPTHPQRPASGFLVCTFIPEKELSPGGRMSLRKKEETPDKTGETTHGTIHFHEWIGDG